MTRQESDVTHTREQTSTHYSWHPLLHPGLTMQWKRISVIWSHKSSHKNALQSFRGTEWLCAIRV